MWRLEPVDAKDRSRHRQLAFQAEPLVKRAMSTLRREYSHGIMCYINCLTIHDVTAIEHAMTLHSSCMQLYVMLHCMT